MLMIVDQRCYDNSILKETIRNKENSDESVVSKEKALNVLKPSRSFIYHKLKLLNFISSLLPLKITLGKNIYKKPDKWR